MDRVRAEPADSDVRCAVCHASAEGAEQCPACATWAHAECRGLVQRCPTLGCSASVRAPDPGARARMLAAYGIRDPNDWRPLAAVLPLLALGSLFYRRDPLSPLSLTLAGAVVVIGVVTWALATRRARP